MFHEHQPLQSIREFFRAFGLAGGMTILLKKRRKHGMIRLRLPPFKGPIHLRAGTSDFPTFEQIFRRREYDIAVDFSPRFIVDAGAHIGLAAVYFKTRFPASTVVCVEPSASNVELLRRNTQAYEDVHCVHAGLWSGPARLKVLDGDGTWGFTTQPASSADGETVAAVSVGDLMRQFRRDRIDILKMDIEGAEKEVFSSGCETWLPKTKLLILELHDRDGEGCSRAFYRALAHFNFSLSAQGENIVCLNDDL